MKSFLLNFSMRSIVKYILMENFSFTKNLKKIMFWVGISVFVAEVFKFLKSQDSENKNFSNILKFISEYINSSYRKI